MENSSLTLQRPAHKVSSRVEKLLQKEETARLNCNIPVSLHIQFQVKCAETRRSQSAVVIELLEKWLKEQ